MRLAVETVSPNKQYLGLFSIRIFYFRINYLKKIYNLNPSTPATTGPEWQPNFIFVKYIA
jgi:hypothetical protein